MWFGRTRAQPLAAHCNLSSNASSRATEYTGFMATQSCLVSTLSLLEPLWLKIKTPAGRDRRCRKRCWRAEYRQCPPAVGNIGFDARCSNSISGHAVTREQHGRQGLHPLWLCGQTQVSIGQAWTIYFPPSLQAKYGAWDPNVFAGGHQAQALPPLCCRELFSLHHWQPRLINRTLSPRS